MSNRTLFEINHDMAHEINMNPESFAEDMLHYLRSGSKKSAEALGTYGITWIGIRHHSEPAPAADSGWVCVPREPTDKMMLMGGFRFVGRVPNEQVFPEVRKCWDDMIAAFERGKAAVPTPEAAREIVRQCHPTDPHCNWPECRCSPPTPDDAQKVETFPEDVQP